MRKLLPLLLISGLSFAEGPYTLDDCRRLARENSVGVKTAQSELESARETRKATFTQYFPQVSASGGVLAGKDPMIDMPAMRLSLGKWANVMSCSVQQTLFAGGRVTNGNRLASLGEDVARDKLTLAQRDAIAQVEEKYWALLSLQGKRRTLEAYDTLLGALQNQAGDAVKHGLSSRNDLLKVSLKRSQAQVGRMQLESGLSLAARDLRRHMGLPEDTALALADTLATPEDPAALAKLREGATDKRIETRLLSQGVRAEELQTSLERGAMLPSVAVGAQAFRMELKGADAVTNAMVFGMISVPLSDIWKEGHATASHQAKLREAQMREQDTRRQIAMGIDKSWDDVVHAYRASLVAEDAVVQAEVNLTEENDRYRSGLATLSDLLEAQALRQEALAGRVDARKDYWMKRCEYLRSTSTRE